MGNDGSHTLKEYVRTRISNYFQIDMLADGDWWTTFEPIVCAMQLESTCCFLNVTAT